MAGLQIRTYVNGNQEYLDLYGDENVTIEVSFAEIQDITKKNSNYTQEFRIPGSKNNNYIFNYFFDINTEYLDWNPKKKFEAELLWNGTELYSGYIRLNSVSINKIEKVYSVTFYSSIGDLVSNIGDKSLCEVNTDSVNYIITALTTNRIWLEDKDFQDPQAIFEFSGTNYYNICGNVINSSVDNGDVELMLAYRGYDYTGTTFGTIRDIDTYNTPILAFSGVPGFFDYYDPFAIITDPNKINAVNLAYLIPSLRVRKLYELIFEQAGYQIQSDFFQTSYFGRQYLPLSFNTESVYLSQSAKPFIQWFNQTGTTQGLDPFINSSTVFDGQIPQAREVVSPQTLIQDNLGYNPFPTDPRLYGVDTYFLRVPQSQFSGTVTYDIVYSGSPCGSPLPNDVGGIFITKLTGMTSSGSFSGVSIFSDRMYGDCNTTGTVYNNTNYIPNFSTSGLYGGYDYLSLSFETLPADYYITNIKLTLSGLSQSLPYTIVLSDEMSCEIKQMDYIQNINRMFNLVVVEHPFKQNTLIVEPIINYIGKGEVLDWTTKVDFDSNIELSPTTSIINGSLLFSNKQDKDYINTEFTKRSNLTFGQEIFNLGVDFKNQQTNLSQSLGQNTDYFLNASGSTNVAFPCYFITKQGNNNGKAVFEYRPFRSLPRVVFKGPPLPAEMLSQGPYYVRYGLDAFPVGYYQNWNRYTTYPWCLSGYSIYQTYNTSDVFTPDELTFPDADTMYTMFYQDYIEDLISPENKIMRCKMYLTPWEVAGLYFNETIIVKNAKWRINKISGLSLVEPGLCDVELVKLTRDYEDFPIKFYDLIPCDCNQPVIHTHSDFNYHLYMLVNKLVSVVLPPYDTNPSLCNFTNTGFYEVVEVDYNPDYTYERVFFDSITVPDTFGQEHEGIKPFYVSTECDGLPFDYSGISPYNQFSTTYSGQNDCFDFTITNTGYSQQTFYFLDCSGNTSSWTLDPSSSISVCGQYGSFSGTNFSICPDVEINLCTRTPLPTPTPSNTPGLSPTPTSTVTPSLPTPTPTNTPSATRTISCHRVIQINVTVPGYIKWVTCAGVSEYFYYPVGPDQINVCIQDGTLLPGYPLINPATFTVTNPGVSC